MRIALGFGNSRAMPSQTPRTAPGCSACIGEPCERKRTGSAANLLHQSFGLEGFLHFGSCSDALLVVGQRGPFRQVELHMRGPAENGEQIGVGDAELVAHYE